MFCDFRKTFHPTQEEVNARNKRIEEITEENLKHREKIELEKHNEILYCSNPFGGFTGDCCFCSNYAEIPAITVCGDCKLHDIPCGSGFTCANNDSEETKNWKEFEKITGEE